MESRNSSPTLLRRCWDRVESELGEDRSRRELPGWNGRSPQNSAPKNVRVNAVHRGSIKMSMTENYFTDEAVIAVHQKRTPIVSLGEPIDVANAVIFFASDRARFIIGELLLVDGGQAKTA
ncbi:MAG: SDR family oxidoreductase [Halalkalicoccus sp.]